jgi:hypothetical protein
MKVVSDLQKFQAAMKLDDDEKQNFLVAVQITNSLSPQSEVLERLTVGLIKIPHRTTNIPSMKIH